MLRLLSILVLAIGLSGCALNRSAQNVFSLNGKKVVVSVSETTAGASVKETYLVKFNGVPIGSATPPVFIKGKRKATDPIVTAINGEFEGTQVLAKRLMVIGLAGVDIRYEIYIDGELMTVVDVI